VIHGATQAVRQALGSLPNASVVTDAARIKAEQAVVTTMVASMQVRQDPPPSSGPDAGQAAGGVALQIFGSFLGVPTPGLPAAPPPQRPSLTHYEGLVTVTATLPGGRAPVSEDAPVQLSLDSRVSPEDGIARAVQQAAEAAARRLSERLAQQR
jgi:hypothetical protein